jgi:hypothetical protein
MATIRCTTRDRTHSRRAGLFWLLCTLFTLLPASAINGIDRGLVYCPLQKAWVKGGGEPVRQAPEVLKSVCASDAAKQKFTYESVRRLGVRNAFDRDLAEKLFFDYSKVGRKAFNALPAAPLPTQPGLSERTAPETVIANGRTAIDSSAVQSVKLPEIRYSVAEYLPISFERKMAFSSNDIFRISTPRAPPVSL